jgi:protein dithiol oxidoreductase (disulfide-forming)
MNRLFVALALSATLALGQNAALALESGKDYLEISPIQKTDVKNGQVEVLEFFWYRCPHCFDLEPELNAWTKKLPKDVVVKKVPGILNPSWAALARAYYALEAVGMLEKLHGDVFNAIHVQGMDLNTPERFFDWAVTKGVDRKNISDAYNSFAVNTKVMRAQQLTGAYKLNGVPAFAVNGKFVTSAYMTGGTPSLFKALDELIAQERKKNGKK